MAKRNKMTKEYITKLLKLVENLDKETNNFFGINEGRRSVSKPMTDEEIKFMSSIKYLIGCIQALEYEKDLR